MEPSSAREDEGRGTDKWEEEEDITAKRTHVEDEEEQELKGLDREHVPVPRFLGGHQPALRRWQERITFPTGRLYIMRATKRVMHHLKRAPSSFRPFTVQPTHRLPPPPCAAASPPPLQGFGVLGCRVGLLWRGRV